MPLMSSGGTHMQLGVIRNKAMVVCKCSDWTLIVVELPTCTTLYEVTLLKLAPSLTVTRFDHTSRLH